MSGEYNKIVFVGQILDNVHGFIPYTAAENQIMETQLFKRLQNIKQLSVVNWVFPGSEHTRFIHSLGVMHIADKMAQSLGLDDNQRRLLRLAGLLHDIGHYPLSHVCEAAYREADPLEEYPENEFPQWLNTRVRDKIDDFSLKPTVSFMLQSKYLHHEAVGAKIVRSNNEICEIIKKECNDDNAPDKIADIITGNVDRHSKDYSGVDPMLVQILHSELDADGIDYLMRDAMFSGTSFGNFELEQLIRCLVRGEALGKPILCITPKGIAAADQYLINKFFSYSQVVFNKHIVIAEWMVKQIVMWALRHNAFFPSRSRIEEWAAKGGIDGYLGFTDNLLWSSLDLILKNELNELVPHHIKAFCENLLRHNELEFIKDSEVRFISSSEEEAKEFLKESRFYMNPLDSEKHITLLNQRRLTKQVPRNVFERAFGEKEPDVDREENQEEARKENWEVAHASRLMEGIAVKDGEDIHLLCDDWRSLIHRMYDANLVLLRSYKLPEG